MAAREPRTPDRLEATADRRRGHAFHAAAGRDALGVQSAVAARVADVPGPLFCAVVAVAVSSLAVLARPQVVGGAVSMALDAALVAAACAAIAVHTRLAATEGAWTTGLETLPLAVAALGGLFIALAGTEGVVAPLLAVAGCAAVTALAPHLETLRALGREGTRERVLRDAAGTLAMLPAALAAASPSLGWGPRMAAVGLLGALTTADALRAADPRGALAATLAVGLLVAAVAPAASHAGSQASGAAGVLLLWYGLRGLAVSLTGARRDHMATVEYLAVSLGAVALLVTQARG